MRMCYNCSKKYVVGGVRTLLRGHYNPTNSFKKQVNLQWANVTGQSKRVKLCIKCLRRNKQKNAVAVKTIAKKSVIKKSPR